MTREAPKPPGGHPCAKADTKWGRTAHGAHRQCCRDSRFVIAVAAEGEKLPRCARGNDRVSR